MSSPHPFKPSPLHGRLVCQTCLKPRTHILHIGLGTEAPDPEPEEQEQEQPPAPPVKARKPSGKPARQQLPQPTQEEPDDQAAIYQPAHVESFQMTSAEDERNWLTAMLERGTAIADQLPDCEARTAILERSAGLWLQLTEPTE